MLKYPGALILFLLSAAALGQGQQRRVLFLGNSYTSVNNLPQMVADVAASAGDSLLFNSNAPGGWQLIDHYTSPVSTGFIRTGSWDYVVLQEQSEVPALPNYSGDADAYALCSLITQYNHCARPLFYMTWGRKNGDAAFCPSWPPVCTYEGMDSLLHLEYMSMTMDNHAQVSPVGALWKYIRQNYPAIDLYQSDESHPSLEGTYAAACCFYASIFRKNPLLISFNSTLNAATAADIRLAAKTVVFDSLASWNFISPDPLAGFSYTADTTPNTVHLRNNSQNSDSFDWTFGDGDTSSLKSPSHYYANNGTYLITLVAHNCDLDSMYSSSFQMNIGICAHNPVIEPHDLILCPNETDTLWTQPYDSYQWKDGYGDSIPGATRQYLVTSGDHSYSVLATFNGCTELSPEVYVGQYSNNTSYQVITYGNQVGLDTACSGDTLLVVFAPTRPPFPDLDSLIQWYEEGIAIPQSHNDTLVVTASGRYGVSLIHPYCPGYMIYNYQQLHYTFIECPGSSTDQEAISCYPDPATSMLNLKLSSPGEYSFKIYGITGAEITSGMLQESHCTINVNELAEGIYFLHIYQAGWAGRYKQFIKLSR